MTTFPTRWGSPLLAAAFTATLALPCTTAQANDELARLSSQEGQWPMYGRDYANTHYSPLKQIGRGNVKNLKLAYTLQLGALRSNESTPIVVGDMLYVSSSWGPKTVFALDAATGAIRWRYEPDLPGDTMQYGCCDVVNRGVSYGDGRIYVGRLDGHLVALDAKTGEELWDTKVVDYKQGAVITSPPLVVKNMVVTGFGGGEYGVRGALSAYDAKTGKQLWNTFTTAGEGEPGNDSWKGDSWKNGGGAAWLIGSYDAKTNTIFYGTSNPSPWNNALRGPDSSDYGQFTNLYTSSTVAFDADTGRIKWWLQGTPYDAWDFDGVNEAVLADLKIDGSTRPVMMKADRNGFFYVAERNSGKLISAQPFVPTNWATGIDLATARPIEVPAKRPRTGHAASDICPNLLGGKNWQPMSFDPNTQLVYIPANNVCMDMAATEVQYKKGTMYLGKEFPAKPGPGDYLGELVAWDPVKQRKAWGLKESTPFNGGTLSTGGGLVFAGNNGGLFRALDAKTGEVLWRMNLGSGIGAGPMTFTAGGKQYVAVVVGRTASIPAFLGDLGKTMLSTPEGGALFVFSL
ncbi:PQQ-dependent dehydrogenase, methanol/ethanol family [Aquincola sp. J276]|uniref:PQQ-dependent dehydrogenase, methanol/ethanol family n=1 Tax=Aquincola sp. J276 TaxID=2898432 RepID=UPI002151CD44|nr:PQQ-dependent dehydrogenase, methanol/ethanol family [Aquincola sp. J276]MCR5864846.1 PQQ-dependent dehydrogenase, methanol/ethanol family [Aquincola sp. J276]